MHDNTERLTVKKLPWYRSSNTSFSFTADCAKGLTASTCDGFVRVTRVKCENTDVVVGLRHHFLLHAIQKVGSKDWKLWRAVIDYPESNFLVASTICQVPPIRRK